MSPSLPLTTLPLSHSKFIAGPTCLQPADNGQRKIAAGLYVHIPFCFHKCHYCDFYSLVEDTHGGDRQEIFTNRLIAELELRAAQVDLHPHTIFIGGGTPTLLRTDLWGILLNAFNRLELTRHLSEWTVEANPETVTPELMDILVQAGVNRISIGAQSFQHGLLKTLERWHEPASVGRAVEVIRTAGIRNFNLDLIFAIPGQTLDQLQADLDTALALQPTHLSCYGLTYEANTAMTKRLELGQFQPIDEDLERDMYALVLDRMEAAGFEQYEVSNWARRRPPASANPQSPVSRGLESSESHVKTSAPQPSFRCAHNLQYWTNANWLGIGPSAASHVDGYRWKNLPHLGNYLDHHPEPPIADLEHLPPARRVGEQLMLRLRLREGISEAWLDQNLAPDDPRRETIQYLAGLNMLERADGHLRLTRQGLFVADAVIKELL